MIQDLLILGLSIGKYIFAAALMVIFYHFLYREKTTFNQCRIYLLSIALVALLISQFSIVVYTPQVKVVEVELPVTTYKGFEYKRVNSQIKIIQSPIAVNGQNENSFIPNKYIELLTIKNIALAVYICVTSVLFILFFIQFFKILALKRGGQVITRDGFEIVESAEIPTPFSFYRTIFLSPNLSGIKSEMILKHEQWHIKHRHYLDVFVMEILVRLFWFNPVLWWIRKELRSVSEFQTDRSVLDEGHDLYKYQTIILEEVMEYNPYLANGFNNSFTKKRFIMMKNKCFNRFATLRRVLILPFFVGVFSLLCFTTGKSEVKYNVVNVGQTDTTVVQSLFDTVPPNAIDSTVVSTSPSFNISPLNVTNNMSVAEIDKVLRKSSTDLGLAVTMLKKLVENYNLSAMKIELIQILRTFDFKINNNNVDNSTFSDKFLSTITKDEIKNLSVTLSKMKNNTDELIKEKSTLAKSEGLKNQMLLLFQDKLISKIISEGMFSGISGMISQSEQISNIMSNALENGTQNVVDNESELKNEKILAEAYRVKKEQIRVSSIPFESNAEVVKISGIEKNNKETKVILAVRILRDGDWVRFDRGFTIIDKETHDRYLIRRLEREIPLDQTLILSNCANKMIEFTLIFPPLKRSVKVVDIIEVVSDDANQLTGHSEGWAFKDVNLKDYKVSSSKVYR